MIKTVVDTNIIVSAFISSLGNPAKILNLILNDEILIYYNNIILLEYEEVLLRPFLKTDHKKITKLLDVLKKIGLYL